MLTHACRMSFMSKYACWRAFRVDLAESRNEQVANARFSACLDRAYARISAR
jgi:hypothetical protein